jgi:hypothetical protein
MWHAHDHVVLGEPNWRRKGCVDLQCGHARGVSNMTCSWSCSTRRIESRKEGMCWSPMWALSRSMQCDVLMIMCYLANRIEEGRDVLISNVGMIEEYATWRAHDHVILGESNRRRKGCVDLHCGHDGGVRNMTRSWSCSLGESNQRRKGCIDFQCGHDRGVCNMTCSWSCSTKKIESTKEGMCWSTMCAWSRSMQCDMLMIM